MDAVGKFAERESAFPGRLIAFNMGIVHDGVIADFESPHTTGDQMAGADPVRAYSQEIPERARVVGFRQKSVLVWVKHVVERQRD
jgi:hypothetical protein